METSRMAGNSFQRRRLLRRLEGGNLQAEGFHTRLGNQTMVTNTRNLTKTHAINEIASLLLKLIFQPRILKPPELEELLRKAAALRSFLRLQQEIPNLRVPNAATCAQDPNLTGLEHQIHQKIGKNKAETHEKHLDGGPQAKS